ncbi:protein NRT1/ PTR FAMILY 5.5-like isoform X2 [Primulina huaijiensis]|uniref:protein NRT1/ PTR FAMILY 5.5-like isoform X2 n=1 Tax=Primulina huaijiensis TaxID=1492673 RepID=UPI003CC72BD4
MFHQSLIVRYGYQESEDTKHRKSITLALANVFTYTSTGDWLVGAVMKSFVRISDILVVYAVFVLQNYLTDVWKLSFTHAAGILNIWGGISFILPVFFLFLVDAFVGHFQMLVFSSVAYSLGISFISMSTPPVLANSCKLYEPQCIGHTKKVLFYTGLSLLAVGVAGHLVSVRPFLKEQEDKSDEKQGSGSICQIAGFQFVVLVPLIGAFALPYIKPWSIRFGNPAICTVVATLLFLSGSCTYKKAEPQGSPLTNVCRVFVAAAFKICEPFPLDANELYKKDGQELQRFSSTRVLRFLEKAAIVIPGKSKEQQEKNRWRLCSVAEVEEAKITVRVVPMWMTFIVCGIVSSFGNTYFVEQAKKMNRKIGKWKVPLQIILMLFDWAKRFFASCYNKMADRFFPGSKKYAPSAGIVMAMIFSILCCITAARIEMRRLDVITRHNLLDKPDENIPMSVYWLLFQFFLLAGLDSFFEKSVSEFFKDQAPGSMKNYLEFFSKGVSGLGFICNVLSVHVVGNISEKGGKPNWFQHTLNRSRLDRYYWVLAGLSGVNLVVYILVAFIYRYKNLEPNNGARTDA